MKRLLCLLLLTVCLFAQTKSDVTEFMLFKRKDPVKVGDVSLALRGTDKGKQRFSIDLSFDNLHLEFKDQYVRVPIFFYVGNEMEPREIVVTSVSDDQITGRLVIPAK